MEECPVCMESFGLDEHIPKSLDCRHTVCAKCVMNEGGQPLQRCPICRRAITDHSTLPNDLTLISYLEKNKREKYLKELKEKVKAIIEQVLEASEDVDGRLKNQNVSTAQTVKDRSAIFSSYIKHLFEQCQQRCSSERFLTDVMTKSKQELESTSQELQASLAACTSLLENPHVTTDDIANCESDALDAVKKAKESGESGTIYGATWNSYRKLVMDTFAEISKVPPKHGSSGAGFAILPTPVGAMAAPDPGSSQATGLLPGDYNSLREIRRYKTQCGNILDGLCFHNHRLFSVENKGFPSVLCMYEVTGKGLTLLDSVALVGSFSCPRVDGYTQQVYASSPNGVLVFSWEDNRLTRQSHLTCVGRCFHLALLSQHMLCVCDERSGKINVVRVTNDTVTDRLRKPAEVVDQKPSATAVLGSSILVWYGERNLVVYENGVSSPGTMVAWPAGLESVCSMSSDGVSRFLVCNNRNAVFILDAKGKLCDKINIGTTIRDCTVGDGKLWVGCSNGDIVVMSPQ